MRSLEQAGLIERYAAVVNQQKAGIPVNVFVSIMLQRQDQADLQTFEEAVQGVPEVIECYLMTGEFDYLLRVVVSDAADFERIHSQHLTSLPGVARAVELRAPDGAQIQRAADSLARISHRGASQGRTGNHSSRELLFRSTLDALASMLQNIVR